jgi:hypothetical protein
MSEPMSSRQFVAADFAPTGGGTFVAGHRDADGTVHIDQWEADPAPGPTITVEQVTFTANQAGWYSIGELRPASGFLVDLDAPPNSCTRCGTDQRGHGEQHAYSAPSDAARLARMKSRRDRRLATPARFDLTPETLVELRVNTGILTAALARLQEGFDEMARVTGPVVQAIRDRHDVIAAANRHADERIAAWRGRLDSAIEWGDPIETADADWPAQGSTCAHVCGGNPDHACDARATTRLTYTLPSGGTRSMPICAPCFESETAAKENAHV